MTERISLGGRSLEVVSLDISKIRVSCASWRIKSNNRVAALITFTGNYGVESSRQDDSRFIVWKGKELIDLVRPSGIVVSFEDLNYEYGDELDFPWSKLDGPMQVVSSQANKQSIAGIFGDDCVVTDLEAAISTVSSKLKGGA